MHPDRMPSISLGVIVPAGATYHDRYRWRTDTGALRGSVHFRAGATATPPSKATRPPCGSWPPP